jgi:hypothetical protein
MHALYQACAVSKRLNFFQLCKIIW